MDFKTVADDLKSIKKELSDNLTARGITVNDTDGPTTLARKVILLNTTNASLDSTEIYDSTVDLNGDCVKFRDYLASQLTAKGISVNDTDGPLTLAQKVNNILLTTNIVLTTDKTTLTSTDPTAHLEAKVTDLRDNPISNVTVEFFVNGSSLSRSLTNSSGIATYDYVSSNGGTFNLTAQLNSVSVYNGSVSNSVSIIVKTYLFYDDATSNKSSNFASSISLRNGGSSTLTYDSTNKYYVITNNNGETESFIPIPALAGKTNFIIEWDSYCPNDQASNGFVIYLDGSNWYKITDDISGLYWYAWCLNGAFTENKVYNTGSTKKWVHNKVTINGTSFSMLSTDPTGTVLINKSMTMDSKMNSASIKVGLDSEWVSGVKTYYKNIKAYSN